MDLPGYRGKNTELASVITLGSSLEYTTSRSSLKMLIPFVSEMKHYTYSTLRFPIDRIYVYL